MNKPRRSLFYSAFFLAAAVLLLLTPLRAAAQSKAIIYFFWGDGCPHCAAAKPVLLEFEKRYPDLQVRAFEVWSNETNQELMLKMGQAHNFKPSAVPTIFLGDKYWVGFSDQISTDIEDTIKACIESGCPDAGEGIVSPAQGTSLAEIVATPEPAAQPIPQPTSDVSGKTQIIDVPLFGKVDLAGQSLWISTLLISFVDGVNPCSIWVLTMLLAITLHTGSRKKVVIIGLIFLTVTAAIYALFIAGLFTMFTFINFMGWIRVVVALVAIFFGAVNIKDYFWYKEGISFTISDEKKPGIYKRMRALTDASQSFGGLVTGTIVMAAGVSLVEFSCTAGFPVLWTNLLVSQKVGVGLFIALLVLYMLIYQLDELVIFFTAVYSLKASKLEEKQGRFLKLIGGVLMFTLAIVMLVNPNLMNNIGSALVIFAIALGVTILILVLHRYVLPSMGIHIGSEFEGKKKRKHSARH